MKKYFYKFAWLLIFIGMSQSVPAQTTLAVLDLNSHAALTKSEERTLTDRLRLMLLRTGSYKIVERAKMDMALKKAGVHSAECLTPECAIKTGKILKVDHLITGSLGKIGELYTVNLILVDVKAAQMLKTVTRDYEGKIEGLINLMQPLAEQLVSGAEPATPPDLGAGTLAVNTLPISAQVFLDEQLIGQSPVVKEEIPAGEHKIRIAAPDFMVLDSTVVIENRKVSQIRFNLAACTKLTIVSEPTQAQVLINDQHAGVTPLTHSVPKGKALKIRVQQDNFTEWTKTLTLKKDQKITVKLRPAEKIVPEGGSSVRRQSKLNKKLLLIGGGTLAAGGVAAALMYGGNDPKSPKPDELPNPPGRP